MTHKTPELPKFTDALPIIPQLRPHQKGNSFTYYKVRMTECRLSLHRDMTYPFIQSIVLPGYKLLY